MKKTKLLVALLAIGLITSSPCYGVEPYVIITKAFTTHANGEEATEFPVLAVVVCHVNFRVFGTEGRYYKVTAITNALGEKIEYSDRVPPGEYMFSNSHHVREGEPGDIELCQYKVKLKKRRDGTAMLKDTDSALSQITIVE